MMYHLHVESSGQKAPFLLYPFLTAPAIAVLGETLPSSALTWRIGLAVLVLALAVKDTLERLLRVCSAPQEMDVDDVIFLVCSVGRSANAGVFSLLVAVEHLKFAQAASMMFGIAALNTSACAAALWIWTGGAATSYPPEGQTLPKTMLLVAVHTAMHLLAKPLLALLPLRLQPETQRTVVTLGELSTLDRTGRTEDAHAFGRMLTKRPSEAHRVVDAHGTVALGDACPPSGVLDSYVDDDDVDGRSDDLVGTAQDLVNAFATIANAQSQVGREQVAAAHRLDSIPPLLSEAATAVATARGSLSSECAESNARTTLEEVGSCSASECAEPCVGTSTSACAGTSAESDATTMHAADALNNPLRFRLLEDFLSQLPPSAAHRTRR